MGEIRALEDHPFVRGLNAEQIRLLEARELGFAAGSFLFREGEQADTLFLVCSGCVALELNVPAWGPSRLESLCAGDIVGLSWLFPPYRWHTDARAVGKVQTFAIDGAGLRDRMAESSALGQALATRLVRQLYERLERVRMQRLDLFRANP